MRLILSVLIYPMRWQAVMNHSLEMIKEGNNGMLNNLRSMGIVVLQSLTSLKSIVLLPSCHDHLVKKFLFGLAECQYHSVLSDPLHCRQKLASKWLAPS